MSSGRIKAYGCELMLQLNKPENENGVFGWLSYTYTRSRTKSGLPYYYYDYYYGGEKFSEYSNPHGDQWLNYSHEQNHSLKVILGYVLGSHTISGKFYVQSSMPYTAIVIGILDTEYQTRTGIPRYYPVYGKPNTRHFPVNANLDLRYSKKSSFSWGYLNWYIEIINILGIFYHPPVYQSWNYYTPYGYCVQLHWKNPARKSFSGMITFIPNFGVEVKF